MVKRYEDCESDLLSIKVKTKNKVQKYLYEIAYPLASCAGKDHCKQQGIKTELNFHNNPRVWEINPTE